MKSKLKIRELLTDTNFLSSSSKSKKEIENISVPHWEDPTEILRKGKVEKVNLTPEVPDETKTNLARAARQGKEKFSKETLNQMRIDRENAKNK